MSKPYRLITGLLFAVLIAFSLPAGIVRAQCDGSVNTVECTGIDPDGWNAISEAPGAATSITVRANSRVEDSISLDGDDTLIIEAGGSLSVTGGNAGIVDEEDYDNVCTNTIVNHGTITSAVVRTSPGTTPRISRWATTTSGISVNSDTTHVINNGMITVNGISANGIHASCPPAEVVNNGHVTVEMMVRGSSIRKYVHGTENRGITVYGSRLINTGSVRVVGAGAMGLIGGHSEFQAVNLGTVSVIGERYSYGLVANGRNSRYVNSGTITAKSIAFETGTAYGVRLDDEGILFANHGTILAQISEQVGTAGGIFVAWPIDQVINTGSIVAEGAHGIGIQGWRGSTLNLLNTGTISGSTAAIAEFYRAFVINRGTLNGDVLMGLSNDFFTAEGGVVNGIIDGGEGTDTLTFAFEVPEGDYLAVATQIAAASPAGGSLTYGDATYTWVNFEKIVNQLNGIFVAPISEVVITGTAPVSGEVIPSAIPAAGEEMAYVPPSFCGSGAFADGRLNGRDVTATVVVYPYAVGGIDLYTPQGEWAVRAEADAIRAALAQAAYSGAPVEIDARLGLALVAQPDGSLLATGPGYAFAFQPSRCGIDG